MKKSIEPTYQFGVALAKCQQIAHGPCFLWCNSYSNRSGTREGAIIGVRLLSVHKAFQNNRCVSGHMYMEFKSKVGQVGSDFFPFLF